jgi:hypothetical protein
MARRGSGFRLLSGGLAAGSVIGSGNLGAGTFGSTRGGFPFGSFFFLFLVFVLRILLCLPSIRGDTENNSKVFLRQSVELEMKC